MFNYFLSRIFGINKFENKLSAFQGYRQGSILKWKKQLPLAWTSLQKILREIKIYTGMEIRENLRRIVQENPDIFDDHCYVTSFGESAKSGNVILYDLKHCNILPSSNFCESWEIPSLPSDCKIVFVDDLIGTGKQSFTYITEKLNLMLGSNQKAYLLCLCATQSGMERVIDGTNFEILHIEIPTDYLNESCTIFSEKEKALLRESNALLSNQEATDYSLGLLIAFYYSVPNNTMPIIWKDGYKYINSHREEQDWFALLPRNF